MDSITQSEISITQNNEVITKREINILVVDDDPDILELSKIYLARMNNKYNIYCCSNPLEVMSILEHGKFSAVIADYQMNELNGIELLQQVRRHPNPDISRIVFILLTGKSREEIAIDALNNGADFYIRKGPDLKSLYHSIHTYIMKGLEEREKSIRLMELQLKYQTLEKSPEIIVIHDLEGNVLYANQTAKNLAGVQNGKIFQMKISDVVPTNHLDSMHQRMRRRLNGDDDVLFYQTDVQTTTGERIPLEVRSIPMFSGNQKVILIIARPMVRTDK